ncbi:cytochrome c oxidase assembly protein [Roseomonas marmotae]|uniref:Cytochrome c oxidase assembly protein n=1 Tax=Roseomonas marmotae TaxID=2768161 RepID=A0ABS3KDF5_9PROT|nr:cytochrome c oxidase assembly protein [Roseomonas marmotae]MBO1075508.1 cytochrome c oxidase assembly protein [Roseomonas marmotae]QTI81452.1 cytochrome c oxidase assembly protein [Roseomonas marmotae]
MRALTRLLPTLLLLSLPASAWAHGGHDHGEVPRWTFDPWVSGPLLASLLLYLGGTLRLWRHAGFGRGIGLARLAAYLAGWLSLAGALLSPLHWFGERLFTLHMVEHEIVMAVAAPLLVLARPGGAFAWALPARLRRPVWRAGRAWPLRHAWLLLSAPLAATVLHGLAIWVWHVPVLFDATVQHVGVHRLQHLSFLLSALLFWWALLRRCQPGEAAIHTVLTMMHTGLLGTIMTFAPRVLYSAQTARSGLWGLTPLEDQQLAGLIMWVPAGTVYAGAALAFLALWIRRSGRAWRAGDAPGAL